MPDEFQDPQFIFRYKEILSCLEKRYPDVEAIPDCEVARILNISPASASRMRNEREWPSSFAVGFRESKKQRKIVLLTDLAFWLASKNHARSTGVPAEGISAAPKKRGRPVGSKNRKNAGQRNSAVPVR